MTPGMRVLIKNTRVKDGTTGIIIAVYATGTHPWAVVKCEAPPYHELCFDLSDLKASE